MSRSFYSTRKSKSHNTKLVKYEGKAEYNYMVRLVETINEMSLT